MKNLFFLVCFIVVASISCQQVAKEESNFTNEMNSPKEDLTLPDGVIPKDIDLYEFINFSDRYTWKDLDNYYLNTLPKHFGKSYYSNLKKATLIHLVDVFDMPKYAGKEKLEFYVQEMQLLEWYPPQTFIEAVSALKDHGWSEEQIRQQALDRYQKNIAFMSKTSKTPNETLAKLNEEMGHLKAFADGYAVN